MNQLSQHPIAEEFRALLVDDEPLYCRALGAALERQGIRCELTYNGAQALEMAKKGSFELVLLDHRLPDASGIELIPHLLALMPNASVVVMTAYQTVNDAVHAMRQGAEDYVVKQPSAEPIVSRAKQFLRRHRSRALDDLRRQQALPLKEFPGLLGDSTAMRQVRAQLSQAATSADTTVLITGETGVGKEVAARHLHQLTCGDQPSAQAPWVTVDCIALPENLAESLLFGHERGSFTGADQTRIGAFEQVRNGTLFLDEIGDMKNIQGKLLRVLESRSFRRVGSLKEQGFRGRVIAGTNRDLKALVDGGEFRLDLFQRLCVFPIQLPPLRKRGDDVRLLAEHFVDLFARKLDKQIEAISPAAMRHLRSYPYPGNVRELRHIIERAVILADGALVEPRHLFPHVLASASPAKQTTDEPQNLAKPGLDFELGVDTLGDLEERVIRQALERADYVKTEAARLLGISRFQLLRRLDKYGIADNR
jgi:DNA-binding NtrC family response regulator